MDTNISWYAMPIHVQIANIGSEVARAIRWKERDPQKAKNFCNKAIEFWEIVKSDPKNQRRWDEIDAAIEELRDYFLGENVYQTTSEVLTHYYDAFLYRV